ncbi:hypothetical protein MMC27_002812 [Xylographa pallens]|nr:hypothetical protein [Xylographa pallens]
MAKMPSEYVTLVSSDGFEFVVRRESAYVAGTIKRMLDPSSNFAEAVSGRCVFENIKYVNIVVVDEISLMRSGYPADGFASGVVLEKVCEYLYYNEKHRNAKDVPDMDIPPELCLELLMAADYLNGGVPSLA